MRASVDGSLESPPGLVSVNPAEEQNDDDLGLSTLPFDSVRHCDALLCIRGGIPGLDDNYHLRKLGRREDQQPAKTSPCRCSL